VVVVGCVDVVVGAFVVDVVVGAFVVDVVVGAFVVDVVVGSWGSMGSMVDGVIGVCVESSGSSPKTTTYKLKRFISDENHT
jgi:hypothetical protein